MCSEDQGEDRVNVFSPLCIIKGQCISLFYSLCNQGIMFKPFLQHVQSKTMVLTFSPACLMKEQVLGNVLAFKVLAFSPACMIFGHGISIMY